MPDEPAPLVPEPPAAPGLVEPDEPVVPVAPVPYVPVVPDEAAPIVLPLPLVLWEPYPPEPLSPGVVVPTLAPVVLGEVAGAESWLQPPASGAAQMKVVRRTVRVDRFMAADSAKHVPMTSRPDASTNGRGKVRARGSASARSWHSGGRARGGGRCAREVTATRR